MRLEITQRADLAVRALIALQAAPARVKSVESLETIDGPTDTGRCVVAERLCNADEPCALHIAWGRARAELRASLGGSQLAEVASA